MRIWWRWLGISGLAVCTIIPQWGVLAVPALVVAMQLWVGQQPTRRNQLAVLLMALPTPWVALAPLGSQHAWWQRILLGLAIAVPWLPIASHYQWALALGCALWPLGQPAQRDDVRWLIPLVQVAATTAWPAGWDVALAGIALVSGAWAWWRHNDDQLQWSGALLCLGLASGAGLVVLPWIVGARVLRTSAQALVALLAWWGIAMALLASGNVWGLALAWQLRNAAQQAVGGMPWGPVLVCGVLAWAVWQLWLPAEVADVE